MYNELYVLKYNNYYNREIKAPLPNVTDYQDYIYTSLGQTNFNPNDGVSAHHDIPMDIDDGDYLIVASGTQVVSRWFIIDHQRICRGQSAGLYRLELLRDVIADNYNATLNSTCFIERAIVDDDNPLIYNSENINTNQQRKSAELLKDDTKMAWLVGFVNRDAEAKKIQINSTFISDIKVDSLEDWEYYKYVGSGVAPVQAPVMRSYVIRNTPPDVAAIPERWTFGSTKMGVTVEDDSTASYIYQNTQTNMKSYLNGYRSSIISKVSNQYKNYFTNLPIQNETDFYGIQKMDGKVIQVGTNTYYKVTLDRTEKYLQEVIVSEDKNGGDLYTYMQNIFDNVPGRE